MPLTPPPFDPELAAALAVVSEHVKPSLTMDQIAELRSGEGISLLGDQDLTRGGAFEIEDLPVPGPAGQPDISLLICRPSAPAAGPRPVFYHAHGGGMVVGTNRVGVDGALDW